MKVIEITTHKAFEWTRAEESTLKFYIKTLGSDLHRLHNLAFKTLPHREKNSIRRKVYRLRMEREYIDTVNNIRQELLGV